MFFNPGSGNISAKKELVKCKHCREETVERYGSTLVCTNSECQMLSEEPVHLVEELNFDNNNRPYGEHISDDNFKYNTKGNYGAKRDMEAQKKIKNAEHKFRCESLDLTHPTISMYKDIRPLLPRTKNLEYALFYRVCRNEKIPVSLYDLSQATDSTARGTKSIGRAYLKVDKELKEQTFIDEASNQHDLYAISSVQLIDPECRIRYIVDTKLNLNDRHQDMINISSKVYKLACEIYKAMKYNLLTDGRDPQGIFGASIHLALYLCQVPHSIGRIADLVGVSKETLKLRFRELAKSPDSDYNIIEYLNFFQNEIIEDTLIRNTVPPCMNRRVETCPHGSDSDSDSEGEGSSSCNQLNYDNDIELNSIPDEVIVKYLNSPAEAAEKRKVWEKYNASFYQNMNSKKEVNHPKKVKLSKIELEENYKMTDYFKPQIKQDNLGNIISECDDILIATDESSLDSIEFSLHLSQ